MASDTRVRIVDSARDLFWSQGYEATSLSDISERSSAKLGSIYYFFRTKTDILEAVLDHYEHQLRVWLIDPVFAAMRSKVLKDCSTRSSRAPRTRWSASSE